MSSAQKTKPVPLEDIDWGRVKSEAEDAVNAVAERGYPYKDTENGIFENVMTTIYGNDFFRWWNEHADH